MVAVSTLRETEPWGFVDQPSFLNGACEVETILDPEALLERLHALERSLGRSRASVPHWGPRTIDLDLLLFGDVVIDTPELVVPHPRLAERRFALDPLVELDPELTLPDGRRLADLLGGLE